jgi:hypothetical protein
MGKASIARIDSSMSPDTSGQLVWVLAACRRGVRAFMRNSLKQTMGAAVQGGVQCQDIQLYP